MPKKTLYLAGPITGMPNLNREEFAAAADHLKEQGFRVINPHDLTDGVDFHPEQDYEQIMRICVCSMVESSDEIITLSGWENSPGAKREVEIARLMHIPVVSIVKYFKNEKHA